MDNTSQCSRGIPNKSDSEQKQDNFYYSSPKAATDMGVSSSESHDLTAFYEMLSASFGVLSQNTGFYPSLDRIIETTLRPLNLGPGGGSYNEPISRLQRFWSELQKLIPNLRVTGISLFYIQSMKVRIKILMHYYNSTIIDCSSLISRLNKVTE